MPLGFHQILNAPALAGFDLDEFGGLRIVGDFHGFGILFETFVGEDGFFTKLTDSWDWLESEDPALLVFEGSKRKDLGKEAPERLEYRKLEEAKRAIEILVPRKILGAVTAPAKADK